MATEAKLVIRDRKELQLKIFDEFVDSILEQAAMTPEQTALLAEYLDPACPNAEKNLPVLAKRDDLAAFVHHIENEAEYIRKEEIRLAARRHMLENFVGHIKSSVKTQLECFGVKKVEGRLSRFSIVRNAPKVVITDETLLPGEYLDYKPTPDKSAIKNALESGKEVPGAMLETGNTRLEIK